MTLPDTYRLLAAFSGVPLKTLPALEAAGLRLPVTDPSDPDDPGRTPISDHHRALLRQLAGSGRIRWVSWGPDGCGYVLSGHGEVALDEYAQRYGPAYTPRRGKTLADVAAATLSQDMNTALTILRESPEVCLTLSEVTAAMKCLPRIARRALLSLVTVGQAVQHPGGRFQIQKQTQEPA